MKKNILLLLCFGFISIQSFAQVTTPLRIQVKKDTLKKTTSPTQTKTVAPAPPPAASNNVYTLTSARVIIKTGNDNKEFPSMIYIEVWPKGHIGANYPADCLYKIHNLKNEIQVNSSVELGLEKYNGDTKKFLLSTIQQTGLELSVSYLPNFFLDAWKIENITWVLEFRDQNNSLHPTMGIKTITFNNANGILNNEYKKIKCITDQNLNPLTSFIDK